LTVYFLAVSNPEDQHDEGFVIDRIENAIITGANSVEAVFSCELLYTRWAWIIRKLLDSPNNLRLEWFIKAS
jgi:hypothetical protein